jgi:threonine synthase
MLTYTTQDIVKALFNDPEINQTHKLAAVNSINWARILAQITYYFHSYFTLARQTSTPNPKVRYVVPTGNFGDILAGYFATRMGLPTDKLIIATNENDILHRFWRSGHYEKKPVHGREAEGGFEEDGVKAHEEGVKETLAPAMDILVSSNFERLLWFLALQTNTEHDRAAAGAQVKSWLEALKTSGGFGVDPAILSAAKIHFASERVSDKQTLTTITNTYLQPLEPRRADETELHTRGSEHDGHYILDPHTAIGVEGALRSISAIGASEGEVHHIALSTAHPAKFANAVELALRDQPGFSFETVLPVQLQGLESMERRVTDSPADWKKVREIVVREVAEEKAALTR